ncbi:MAG: hypothetical protein N6V49_15030, partial [Serratia symbiotica]|nr:hypothetical protein [Serratia symbiotica]
MLPNCSIVVANLLPLVDCCCCCCYYYYYYYYYYCYCYCYYYYFGAVLLLLMVVDHLDHYRLIQSALWLG